MKSYVKSGPVGSYSNHSTEKNKDGWNNEGSSDSYSNKSHRGVKMSYEKFQVKEITMGAGSKPGKDYAKKVVKFGTEVG
jgi:hypothetical protein